MQKQSQPDHEQPLVSCKVPKQKTSLDTDLFFYQVENELQAELTYNADVFAEDTANRFAESLQVTVRTPCQVAVQHCTCTLSVLTVLHTWNLFQSL